MLRCFVIADAESADAVQWALDQERRLCDALRAKQYEHYELFTQLIPKLLLGDVDNQQKIKAVFETLTGRICAKSAGTYSSSDRAVGILDARLFPKIEAIPILSSSQGLLMLAFPEILWVPCLSQKHVWEDREDGELSVPVAIDLALGGFSPLFDGTGLRSTLLSKRDASPLKYARQDIAVAVDEERHFACFNAYVAFRFGYRAFPVMTNRVAERVLKCDRNKIPTAVGCRLTDDPTVVAFEDAFVEFADLNAMDNGLHALGCQRNQQWTLLANADYRVLTTAADDSERIAEDEFGGCVSAKSFFTMPPLPFANIMQGKKSCLRRFLFRTSRVLFNGLAGGCRSVLIWNVLVFLVVGTMLVVTLFRCPVLFIPLLFAVFAICALAQLCVSHLVDIMFGRDSAPSLWLKIRSQWRFFPRLFENHFPLRAIHRRLGNFWCMVDKPISGVFGLRNKCGLPNGRNYDGLLTSDEVCAVYRHATAGVFATETGREIQGASHAAPGMAQDVAAFLISRAEQMKVVVSDVEGAIHAAVLATCAYELLGNKTPALSVEALRLRHYFEVLAECEFPGVRAKFDMRDRYTDIHNSMWQVCRTSQGKVRQSLFVSSMAGICDCLASLLRENGKFEEAAFFSRKSRHMHRLLLPGLLRNLLAYPEWAVRSKGNFAFSVIALLSLFVVYFYINRGPELSLSHLISQTYLMLFATQPDVSTFADKFKLTIGKTTAEIVVQVMRQLVLIHVAFLAALFYDFMNRK